MSIQALVGVSQSGVPFNGAPGRRPTSAPLDGEGDGSVATASLDAADIDRQLRSGDSVAAVAAAKGVPAAKIIEAIMTLMLPNADSNGDIAERIALHRTAPVHHKAKTRPVADPVARHEAAVQDAALPGHAARVAQAQQAVPGTHNTTATTTNLNATASSTVIQSAVADHESLSTARSIDTYV